MTKRVNKICALIVLVSGMSLVASAATRVALVSGEASKAIAKVMDVATAKLSAEKSIELLERKEIARVLAEQKLSIAGIMDAEKAVAIGKLLSVDLFAVVESDIEKKEAIGLVVFNAKSGVRLWDAALPGGGLEKTADGIATAVRESSSKNARLGKDLKTVCLLTVRNADLPRSMDSFCDAVGALLERELIRSPDIAVLERKRLEHLNVEKAFPSDFRVNTTSPSFFLIELEVARKNNAGGYIATALITDNSKHEIGRAVVENAKGMVLEMAVQLRRKITDVIHSSVIETNGDSRRESARFFREAELHEGAQEYAAALRATETAYALDPQNETISGLLAQRLLYQAFDRFLPERRLIYGGIPWWRAANISMAGAERAVSIAERALELRYASFIKMNSLGIPGLMSHSERSFTERVMPQFLSMLDFLDDRLDPNLRQRRDFLRERYCELCGKVLESWAQLAEKNPDAFGGYTDYFTQFGSVPYAAFSRVAVEFTDVLRMARRWVEVADRNNQMIFDSLGIVLERLAVHSEKPKDDVRRQELLSQVELIMPLYQLMKTNSHPFVNLYGQIGELRCAVATRSWPEEAMEQRYAAIKKSALRIVAHPLYRAPNIRTDFGAIRQRVSPESESRALAFEAIKDAIQYALPTQRVAGQEYVELANFILGRKELDGEVITEAGKYLAAQPNRSAEALQFYETAFAILNSQDTINTRGESWSASGRRHLRNTLEDQREKVLAVRGSIPSVAMRTKLTFSAPWENQREIFNVSTVNGLHLIRNPILVDDVVYAVGFAPGEGKSGIEARGDKVSMIPLKIPLNGAPAKTLGKVEVNTGFMGVQVSRREGFVNALVQNVCYNDKTLFVGTRDQGIFEFSLRSKKISIINIASGLPSNFVQAFVVTDGVLYAALGEREKESYFIRYNLSSKRCDVLASNRRKQIQSPLDDRAPFDVRFLFSDAKRNRLLFIINEIKPKQLSGLWQLDLKTSQLNQMIQGGDPENSSGSIGWASELDPDHLLFSAGITGVFKFSRVTNTREMVYDARSSTQKELPQPNFPALLLDNWLWLTHPWGRVSLHNKYFEPFPDLEETDLLVLSRSKKENIIRSLEIFQLVNKNQQILVGTEKRLWLLDLKKEGEK